MGIGCLIRALCIKLNNSVRHPLLDYFSLLRPTLIRQHAAATEMNMCKNSVYRQNVYPYSFELPATRFFAYSLGGLYGY